MQSCARRFIEIGAVLLLLTPGCTAEPSSTKSDKSDGEAKAKPEPAKPTPTEVDTAAPPEPPSPPELARPSAGEGFVLGAKLEADVGAVSVSDKPPLSHAGATVSVHPHVIAKPEPEGESTLHIQVRVEFEGAEADRGLNHTRVVAGSYCDELVPELQEIAKLEGGPSLDGLWLVDAQLACRGGEDYFVAENAHTLIAVDSKARTAAVLWTGADQGSNSMGVCVSSSVSSFEVSGEELIIRKTEVTELDEEAAKELSAAAEGCADKPVTTTEVARIKLARGQ